MSTNLVERIEYFTFELPNFGIHLTYVKAFGALWLGIPEMCKEFGVAAPDTQIRQLRKNPAYYPDNMHVLPTDPDQSKRGSRSAWHLKKHRASWWIINLDDSRTDPKFRGKLQFVQMLVMEVGDRLVFGDASPTVGVSHTPVVYQRPVRGELHFGCPACGAPLCMVLDEQGQHIIVGTPVEPPFIDAPSD